MTKWAAAFACLPISNSTQEMGGQAGRAGWRAGCAEVSGLGQRHSQQFSSAVAQNSLVTSSCRLRMAGTDGRCDRRRRKGKSFRRDHCCNTTPKLPSPSRRSHYLV